VGRRGGWTRVGSRRHFRYVDGRGRRLIEAAKLERIQALAILPAWPDVWISPRPAAKLQARGVDAAGRRQYFCHLDFRAAQHEAKFDRLVRFADSLPAIPGVDLGAHRVRAAGARMDLRRRGSPDHSGCFRVGDERSAKAHKTFGITTLRKSHVSVRGSRIAVRFRDKHKIWVRTALIDTGLAEAIKVLLERRGGRRFFRYELDGVLYGLTARRLNE
jgi:DNA topoisomerase-1